MAWEKLVTVSGDGTSTEMLSGTFTAKKFLQLQWWIEDGASIAIQFNGDTGTNYARRWSANGGAETTTTGLDKIGIQYTTTQISGNAYIINNASQEKLLKCNDCERNTAGAGNAPYRFQCIAKWTNTVDSITSIRFSKSGANYTVLDNFILFGTD